MKTITILSLLMMAPAVFAKQSVAMDPINFQVSAGDALFKLEKTVTYPEGLLKRYKPFGAKITNKRVSQNVISFVATKSKFFISKSVYVNGILDSNEDSRSCSKGDKGYSLKMSFDSSDDLVTNNVDELQAIICLRSLSDSKLSGTVRAKIILGNKYSSTFGPIAVNMIKAQVQPLLNAITEEIQTLR